ncbi:hypothetical protein BH23BAC2_BH23BAC2_02650 [soil metagenome]
MKKNLLKGASAVAIILTTLSFTTNVKKEVNTKESTITWIGKKVTGSHTGNITLKEGHFNIEDGKPVGGAFIMDMKSIEVTDLKGGSKDKLEGHLKSDDFFGVEKFPTAKLVVTSIKEKSNGVYAVVGNLTIKDDTHPVNFDLQWRNNTASTNLTIDRSKFNVRYGSGSFFDNLGDNTIYDNFDLEINLKF